MSDTVSMTRSFTPLQLYVIELSYKTIPAGKVCWAIQTTTFNVIHVDLRRTARRRFIFCKFSVDFGIFSNLLIYWQQLLWAKLNKI